MADCGGGCTYECSQSCRGECQGGCGYEACASACSSSCSGGCSSGCTGCSGNCSNTCQGCSGTCSNTCSGTCSGSCTSCSNTCTGSCQGCTGCTSSCSGHCDNACTAASQAETIANIGANIIRGNIIKAADFTSLKAAIAKEYQRRGKAAPPAYSPAVVVGNVISLNAISQVFDDCYNINASSTNDWRGTVKRGDPVYASKIQPCVTFIKGLAAQITVK